MTPTRYLLDTNMASYVIKGNHPHVREHLLEIPMARMAVSAVTEAELRFSAARRPEAVNLQTAVEEFLLRVESLAWDSAAARHYARTRAALEGRGKPVGNLDLMIAAHALAAQAVLVTHERVFRRIKDLKIEDWTRA